ncbi:MAG: hypothetical protein RLZZ196_691 [Bacteroidota bacterium]|jgi:hypothetical protein
MSKYITTEVEVELDSFDDDELIEELDRRGIDYNTKGVDADEMRALLEQIWQHRRTGQNYQRELDQLIYGILGKIV